MIALIRAGNPSGSSRATGIGPCTSGALAASTVQVTGPTKRGSPFRCTITAAVSVAPGCDGPTTPTGTLTSLPGQRIVGMHSLGKRNDRHVGAHRQRHGAAVGVHDDFAFQRLVSRTQLIAEDAHGDVAEVARLEHLLGGWAGAIAEDEPIGVRQ